MRAASSGSLVPADGLLLAGAAGVEAAAGEGAGLLTVVAAGSTLGTVGDAADTTGGLGERGAAGAEDTTMAGTLPGADREARKRRFNSKV